MWKFDWYSAFIGALAVAMIVIPLLMNVINNFQNKLDRMASYYAEAERASWASRRKAQSKQGAASSLGNKILFEPKATRGGGLGRQGRDVCSRLRATQAANLQAPGPLEDADEDSAS